MSPKVAKPKKVAAKKKTANGYEHPKPIPSGTVLTDQSKQEWRIGKSIGCGGFGEIYSATKVQKNEKNVEDYPFVVKIEPHGNGPLFVEMHFYMRNAKLDDIENFKKQRKLKALGMPNFVGSGSHEQDKVKHRFVVMPRYGQDLWSIFLKNDRKMPLHTVYRLALQLIDVLDYIHNRTYVHADIKGANILLEFVKDKPAQTYLVDFGLASHYTMGKDFKPDPKKMHNGTIEYTSRDAHNGVPTMRSDMEILAYNLIEWCGTILPWVSENLLANPAKVQQSKESHMKDPSKFLAGCFKSTPIPTSIKEYVQYVATLKFDQQPDYKKCSNMFEKALKALGKPNSGALEFCEVVAKSKATTSKAAAGRVQSPAARQSPRVKRDKPDRDTASSPESVAPKRSRKDDSKKKLPKPETEDGGGDFNNVIINNEVKGKKKSKKVYEFNFELDVSIDADVIVNVKRRKRSAAGDEKAKTEKKTNVKKEILSPKVKDEEDNEPDQSASEDEEIVPEFSPPPPPPKVATSRRKNAPAVKTVKKTSPPVKVNRIIPAAVGRAGEYKGKKAQQV